MHNRLSQLKRSEVSKKSGNPLSSVQESGPKGHFEDSLFDGIYDPNANSRMVGNQGNDTSDLIPKFEIIKYHNSRFLVLTIFSLC